MRVTLLLPLAALVIAGCNPAAQPVQKGVGNDTRAVVHEPSPTPSPTVDLSPYAGKYPFDLVDGAKFIDLPAVREAIEGAVNDSEIRKWMLSEDSGPSTPIALRDGLLISHGCEAHNCGMHNWSLIVRPDGTAAQVCYDESGQTGGARWYAAGELLTKKDTCPAGD